MVSVLFSFFEETILILYILVGILISSFVTRTKDLFLQKRIFYLFFKFTFLVLIVCLISTTLSFLKGFTFNESTFDSLSFTSFYFHDNIQFYTANFFRKDLFSVFLNVLLTIVTLFYLYLVYDAHKISQLNSKYYIEVPVLIITVFLSLKLFLYAYDLILIVITLELTAFCSIILLSLQITNKEQTVFPFEAAIKYFIFNAIAISLFLFAIGSYYSLYKSINLFDFPLFLLFEPSFCYEHIETLTFIQLIFFSAYLLKLGAAPFHQWVPDVYEGVELLMTAFLVLLIGPALNFKLFVFIKILLPVFDPSYLLFSFFTITGLVSILIGSFNAFLQTRIKRFLAYTGISHLGYILLSFGTATFLGFFASLFYLFFYIITNMVFFALLILTRRLSGITLIFLNQLKLLLNENLILFLFFLIPLLSFAGFPPFAGFFSKFFMIASLMDQQKIGILILLVLYIVLSAYLYLRFIKIAIFEKIAYSVFLPLKTFSIQTQTTQYYKVNTSLKPYKKLHIALANHHGLFFILFWLNLSLFLTLGFLPTLCLFFQQPLLSLFLFY